MQRELLADSPLILCREIYRDIPIALSASWGFMIFYSTSNEHIKDVFSDLHFNINLPGLQIYAPFP